MGPPELHSTASLRGIDNVGGGVAWASGTNGTVLRTEDGGHRWETCAVPTEAQELDFRGIQAFDVDTAIVMSSGKGDLSRLYKTTDGCKTWKLVFTNPDKDGFWDAVRIDKEKPQVVMANWANQMYGVLIGDPVNRIFSIWETHDTGSHWERFNADDTKHQPKSEKDESLFAASNEALAVPGNNAGFTFVTGGGSTRICSGSAHSPLDAAYWIAVDCNRLPFPLWPGAGAFALGTRAVTVLTERATTMSWLLVETTVTRPCRVQRCFSPVYLESFWAIRGASNPQPHPGLPLLRRLRRRHQNVDHRRPERNGHLPRRWQNWMPLEPGALDQPDADKNWNAPLAAVRRRLQRSHW